MKIFSLAIILVGVRSASHEKAAEAENADDSAIAPGVSQNLLESGISVEPAFDDAPSVSSLRGGCPEKDGAGASIVDSALVVAAEGGDYKAVMELMTVGVDVNERNRDGETALIRAAGKRSNTRVISALIASGADVNARSREGETALLRSVGLSINHKVVQALITAGADVDAASVKGETPLMRAAAAGRSGVVGRLISAGANLDCFNDIGETALTVAAFAGKSSVVRSLIEGGADVKGVTALFQAVANLNLATAVALIYAGADLDADNGGAILSLASEYGVDGVLKAAARRVKSEAIFFEALVADRGCLEELVKEAINGVDRDGMSDLMRAAREGKLSTVKGLLAAGANVDAINKFGDNALILAATGGDTAVVEALIAGGSNINHMNNRQETALYHAALTGHVSVVEALIIVGARVDECAPLVSASSKGFQGVVDLLLAAGAKVDAEDADGNSAFFMAIKARKIGIVNALIDAEPQIVDRVDRFGKSALSIAVSQGDLALVEKLLARGARIHNCGEKESSVLRLVATKKKKKNSAMILNVLQKTQDSRSTPLVRAARRGDIEALNRLIRAGKDVNLIGQDPRDTPLIAAIRNGHFDCVVALIAADADVFKKDQYRKTPIKVATRAGLTDIAKILSEAAKGGKDEGRRHLLFRDLPWLPLFCISARGETPLMLAVWNGDLERVVQLIAKSGGADVNAVNECGTTALILAAYEGDPHILDALLAAQADVNAVDKDGKTALIVAVGEGRSRIVTRLIAANAHLDMQAIDGPLMIALRRGDKHIARQLIDARGADVLKISNSLKTTVSFPLGFIVETCGDFDLLLGIILNGLIRPKKNTGKSLTH